MSLTIHTYTQSIVHTHWEWLVLNRDYTFFPFLFFRTAFFFFNGIDRWIYCMIERCLYVKYTLYIYRTQNETCMNSQSKNKITTIWLCSCFFCLFVCLLLLYIYRFFPSTITLQYQFIPNERMQQQQQAIHWIQCSLFNSTEEKKKNIVFDITMFNLIHLYVWIQLKW